MLKISLLDPSSRDNQNNPSLNLGDIIIFSSIHEQLKLIFPNSEIIRISSHSLLEKKQISIIRESAYCFIGGTNLLTADITKFNGMPLSDKRLIYLFPPVKNLILMGVGWGFGYNQPIKFKTRLFYKRILHHDHIHSCRDTYTATNFKNATRLKTINTSCPTLWNLSNPVNYRRNNYSDCLLTLTDYGTDHDRDSKLITTIIEHFKSIFFFPQGSRDKEYIESLKVFKNNRSRFILLEKDYQKFRSFLQSSKNITYIGTRLHAGIMCMQNNIDSLIIGIDNRATEIHKDTMLAVVKRDDLISLRRWINGEKIFTEFKIPNVNINIWKNQFV